ncbi:hypothetical protein D3C86_2176720 [compost metagenome]
MRIQLAEQALALGEELRRFEMAMLAIAVLMQMLHGLQGVAQLGQVLFQHRSADAETR